MPECVTIRRKHRKPCIGDLKNRIVLQNRVLTPDASGPDVSEVFTPTVEVWASVKTSRGETTFAGTDTEQDITDVFIIRFLTGVTAETWIEFKSRRFDILDVENWEERGEWLVLRSISKGTIANAANDA